MKTRIALYAFLCAVLVPCIGLAEVSDEDWKKVNTDFKKKWANRDTRLDAIQVLAPVQDVRAVELMWKVLTKMRPSADIRDAILDALGNVTDEKSIDFLAGQITNKMSDERRLALLNVLSKVDNPKVRKGIVDLLDDKSWAVRTSAIHACGVLEEKSGAAKIVKALNDDQWQVRAAAIECCVKLMLKDAVPVLIERMGKEDGRLEGDLIKALRSMTGENKDTALAWKAWWNNTGKKGDLGGGGIDAWKDHEQTGSNASDDAKSDGSIATYYGIKIYSKRLIFVIDMSGSMDKKYRGKKPKNKRVTVTLTGGGGKKGGKPRTATLNWAKIKTKWDLAREQLIFTLKQLSPKTEFTIIYYHERVKVWKKKLVKATPSNVNAAISALRKIKPQKATNIHGALKKAFQIGGNTEADQVELSGGSSAKKGGDTIFFLTDGWPTIGKVVAIKMGSGKKMKGWLPKMMKELDKWNRTRRLKIHCIGIGVEHCKALMSEVSGEYGGDYIVAGEDDVKDPDDE